MKAVPKRDLARQITLLILPFSLIILVPNLVEAQETKRKGGFGALFSRNKTNNNSSPTAQPVQQVDRKAEALKAILMNALPPDRHYREVLADAIVIAYRNRGYKNLWNHRAMPDRLYRGLSYHINRHGIPQIMALDPNSYSNLTTRRGPVNNRDLGYTIAIADAGALVRLGPVAPDSIWPDWDKGDRPGLNRNSPDTLAKDLLRVTTYRNFDAGAAVDTMASRNWIYRELQNGFVASQRALANASKLPTVPDPASAGLAKPGQPCGYAGLLAENLAMRGHLDLDADARRSLQVVSPELTEGIKAFQRANGLTPDGVFGSGSWKYLSANPGSDLRNRAINLNRSRLLPDEFGKRYLIINLPSAELYAFDGAKHDFTMRIVHGKNDSEEFHTKIFRDIMREVVFAPYWNVPESISMKEIYPKVLEDPTYLATRHYEIVENFNDNTTVLELNEETLPRIESGDLWLRQKPTAGNALGKVKFLLPNQFHIYLHDTPSKQYFAMSNRAQSHGCVRLADPPKMAQWTLKGQDWDAAKIAEAMNAATQSRESLKEPINVYITYFTSFPRPSDTSAGDFILAPARDVYKLDEKDAETLAAVLP